MWDKVNINIIRKNFVFTEYDKHLENINKMNLVDYIYKTI